MTTDDSKAAVQFDDIEPASVLSMQGHTSGEPQARNPNQDGASVRNLMVLWIPWFISLGVMGAAVILYLWVHPWPESFTENVLGIIVAGAVGFGGSMTINRIYKDKVEYGSSH
ncbi:MAG: hypothetical protein IS632_09525 [Thaumarchaeota archaeon]|nr:hypothetical protein [Nitrososphaerota archaeon]